MYLSTLIVSIILFDMILLVIGSWKIITITKALPIGRYVSFRVKLTVYRWPKASSTNNKAVSALMLSC